MSLNPDTKVHLNTYPRWLKKINEGKPDIFMFLWFLQGKWNMHLHSEKFRKNQNPEAAVTLDLKIPIWQPHFPKF